MYLLFINYLSLPLSLSLQLFPELRFRYVEESQPEEFFIPYLWTLVHHHCALRLTSNKRWPNTTVKINFSLLIIVKMHVHDHSIRDVEHGYSQTCEWEMGSECCDANLCHKKLFPLRWICGHTLTVVVNVWTYTHGSSECCLLLLLLLHVLQIKGLCSCSHGLALVR